MPQANGSPALRRYFHATFASRFTDSPRQCRRNELERWCVRPAASAVRYQHQQPSRGGASYSARPTLRESECIARLWHRIRRADGRALWNEPGLHEVVAGIAVQSAAVGFIDRSGPIKWPDQMVGAARQSLALYS